MTSRIFTVAAVFCSLLAGTAAMHAETIRTDSDRLYAGQYITYNDIAVDQGEHASVAVQGDGDTTLHLEVYDYNNNLIDESTCRTDTCLVSWVAYRNANFYVKVTNYGSVYNDYSLAMRRY